MARENHEDNHSRNVRGEGFKDHNVKATTNASSHRSMQDSTSSRETHAPNRPNNRPNNHFASLANAKSWLLKLPNNGVSEESENRKARLQEVLDGVGRAGLGHPGAKANAHHDQKRSGGGGNRKGNGVDRRGIGAWAGDRKS